MLFSLNKNGKRQGQPKNKEDGSLLVNSSMRISTNVDSVDNGVYVVRGRVMTYL